MRLIFALMVIIGHAPEMVDANQSREPLFALTGTTTMGSFAVSGFFLFSGYLIAASMLRGNALKPYILNRILRIYPGFIAASLICVFVIAPLVGGNIGPYLIQTLFYIACLHVPMDYPGQFYGMINYPNLNGAVWTIAYELRCYILLAILWKLGVLQRRRLMVTLACIGIASCVISSFSTPSSYLIRLGDWHNLKWVIGMVIPSMIFTTTFLIGSCFFLYQKEFFETVNGKTALVCALVAGLLLATRHLDHFAMMTFGAVTLFWIALRAPLGRFQKINDRWDISYGTYLYGWPVATCIRWIFPAITPLELIVTTVPLALLAGAASWYGLERYAKVWHRSTGKAPAVRDGTLIAEPLAAGPKL